MGLQYPVWNPSLPLGWFYLWLMPGCKFVFNPRIVIIFQEAKQILSGVRINSGAWAPLFLTPYPHFPPPVFFLEGEARGKGGFQPASSLLPSDVLEVG